MHFNVNCVSTMFFLYLVPFLSQNLQAISVTWWDFCPESQIRRLLLKRNLYRTLNCSDNYCIIKHFHLYSHPPHTINFSTVILAKKICPHDKTMENAWRCSTAFQKPTPHKTLLPVENNVLVWKKNDRLTHFLVQFYVQKNKTTDLLC